MTAFFFFWRGDKNIWIKKNTSITYATWRVCLKKYLQTLQQEGVTLQSWPMPWTPWSLWSLHGKPSVTNASAYESGADFHQSADSLWLSPAAVPERDEMWDPLLLDTTLLCLCSDSAFLSETSVLTVSKRSRIFRLSLKKTPNLEDPKMLQAAACYSELTHWNGCGSSHTLYAPWASTLLNSSKVWIREVLKVFQHQTKRPTVFSLQL